MKPISSPDDVQHKVPQRVEEFTKVKHKEVFGKSTPNGGVLSLGRAAGGHSLKTPTKTKTKTKTKLKSKSK